MKGITKRQREILDFIQQFITTHHFSPSYREIMKHFGLASAGSVYKHVHALKRKGFLETETRRSRSIAPVGEDWLASPTSALELPLIGQLNAGYPIETFPQTGTVAVPQQLVNDPDKTYVLRAKGIALAEDLISDGDLLLVEAKPYADPGEMILASLLNQDTLLKRYYPEGEFARLESLNQEGQPVVVRSTELVIQGVVVGLIRAY